MCPQRKIKWFEKNEWRPDDIAEARRIVISRWNESYKGPDDAPATAPQPAKQKVRQRARGAPAY